MGPTQSSQQPTLLANIEALAQELHRLAQEQEPKEQPRPEQAGPSIVIKGK